MRHLPLPLLVEGVAPPSSVLRKKMAEPSPPREAMACEGEEERQSQRGNAGRQRERAERGKEPEPTGGAPGSPC